VFHGLLDVMSASPWTYAVILGIAALDAVIPVVPSETALVSAGALAGTGDLSIALVLLAGATGALAGDTGAYSLGRALGPRFDRAINRHEKLARRRAWADEELTRRGGRIILTARFVPGGRTATTVTAGIVAMRFRRFVLCAAAAAAVWATTAVAAGYVGGRTVEDHPVAALAAGVLLTCALVVHLARRWRTGDPADSTAPARP
jgi:membrane protein DedA with SNARE-associated domain